MILIPKYALGSGNSPIMAAPGMKTEGFYRAVLRDSNGDIKQDTGWIHNLMTNKGVVKMGAGTNNPFGNGWVGSGSTPPAYTDVGVESLIGNYKSGTTSDWERLGAPTYGVRNGHSYTWGTGESTGTLREFCTTSWSDYSYASSNTEVTMRVLFPAPIVKGAMDQLTVYYEYFVYPELDDQVGVVDIEGVAYNYTARLFKINSLTSYPTGGIDNHSYPVANFYHGIYNGGAAPYPYLAPITSDAGYVSSSNQCSHVANGSLVGDGSGPVTYSQDFIWDIDHGNIGVNGVRCMRMLTHQFAYNTGGGVQISIGKVSDGSAHPKENTHELILSASVSTSRIP